MAVGVDGLLRPASQSMLPLEDRFEVIKEIGDGSFGSVALARVRGAGSNVARRGTMIAIKTMKRTYESFAPCLELREIIFLRTLPSHPHLIPALDIFLDPTSKKLHICMEHMDGNLYQLMKARDHKCMEGRSVKSILYQILAGLNHIHAHNFFHRDIKPENILVSTSAPQDSTSAFSRYSALVTPPSTPPTYSIKIADFGLARETHSRLPYTTYVSTRWYRAPEVLLRAGEYSAPVDIWAVGAMAVEIATLKPLFPGGNEVDQVWRVCEIMGSPGHWYNKAGSRVGGGDWREGTRLAQKLGFSFPKMAPRSIETILPQPQWPASFSTFVTWCLLWDPKNRPTSKQALEHPYFADAVDPLRPRSSTSRLLGRKHSDLSFKSPKETCDSPTISIKPSWFRRSVIGRESAPSVPIHDSNLDLTHHPAPRYESGGITIQSRPLANKRSTWADGSALSMGAPMPILPSIRPISPFSNAVTAQAGSRLCSNREIRAEAGQPGAEEKAQKIGRQLSVNSQGNHYGDNSTEQESLGGCGPLSPRSAQKQSFFSHLRKRARRFSGRHGASPPNADDVEAGGADVNRSNRSSILAEKAPGDAAPNDEFTELDKALQSVRYSLEHATTESRPQPRAGTQPTNLQRHRSLPQVNPGPMAEPVIAPPPVSSRTRRAMQMTTHPVHRYETPEEEDELLDEVLTTANAAAVKLAQYSSAGDSGQRSVLVSKDPNRQSMPLMPMAGDTSVPTAYPTPSPSAKRNGVLFGKASPAPNQYWPIDKSPAAMARVDSRWPTPPYEDSEIGAATMTRICPAGLVYR